MNIKIGRHTYEITADDIFMDNGACVQLMTQSKTGTIPVLSKKLGAELNKLPRVTKSHKYGDRVHVFSLAI